MLPGCGDILHSTDWNPICAEGCGGGAASGGAGGDDDGASAGGETGAGASHSASGGQAGGGGAPGPAACGNGVIEEGETCDDANAVVGDGCEGCVVVCDGANEVEAPETHVCYRHPPAAEVVWQDARDACVVWGGDLLAIADAEEQAWVQTFIAAHAWMGGNDLTTEGKFVWSNGEPFGYTNWLLGEPSDSTTGEDCVEIFAAQQDISYLWNDTLCAALLSYICERPPPQAR